MTLNQNKQGQVFLEFVMFVQILILATGLMSILFIKLVLPVIIKIDLYELARIRMYRHDTPCVASNLWPHKNFKPLFFCSDSQQTYGAKLSISITEKYILKIHEQIQL